ncbi:MAG: endonuclease III [Chlorobi bacterium]|nr:MAG: endonuclease III [Chlorobi bacterium OLB7]MBK8909847.1 endonuclease III [Chlorobiota bacterium]MBX7215600.1 endonuclease III [Candidatus Kapabacteria bacterium]
MPQPAQPHRTSKQQTAVIARRLKAFIGKPYLFHPVSVVETLVATILSQNTSDRNSERAYRQLRVTWESWDQLAQADQGELAAAIRVGGLAEQKSRTILNALRALRQRHGNLDSITFSDTFADLDDDAVLAELTSIPGVGLKTASCVLMFALGRDVCAVDTHVHRVANRLGIVHARTADATFHALRPLLPKNAAVQFHVDLIRFGRWVCKAQRPHCFHCPLYQLCQWPEREAIAAAAQPGPNPVSGDILLSDILRPHH